MADEGLQKLTLKDGECEAELYTLGGCVTSFKASCLYVCVLCLMVRLTLGVYVCSMATAHVLPTLGVW